MSYERQRNVEDGQEVILEGNLEEKTVTKGPLIYVLDEDGKARPIHIDVGEIQMADQDLRDSLSQIVDELKELNFKLSLIIN